MVYPSLSKPVMADRGDSDEVELDPGCTYLLLNRRRVSHKIQRGQVLIKCFKRFRFVCAYSERDGYRLGCAACLRIKPGWYDIKLKTPEVCPPASAKPSVRLAYQCQHPMFPTLAKAIVTVLKQYNVDVELFGYETDPPHADNVDIWINPMGIANNRDDALAGWLMDYSFLDESAQQKTSTNGVAWSNRWRSGEFEPIPARQLGKQLVQSNQLIPVFHCWLGVNKDQCGTLQNAKCLHSVGSTLAKFG